MAAMILSGSAVQIKGLGSAAGASCRAAGRRCLPAWSAPANARPRTCSCQSLAWSPPFPGYRRSARRSAAPDVLLRAVTVSHHRFQAGSVGGIDSDGDSLAHSRDSHTRESPGNPSNGLNRQIVSTRHARRGQGRLSGQFINRTASSRLSDGVRSAYDPDTNMSLVEIPRAAASCRAADPQSHDGCAQNGTLARPRTDQTVKFWLSSPPTSPPIVEE